MQKDYEQIKLEIKERIRVKEKLLEEQVAKEKKIKELKELLAMEKALESNIKNKQLKFSDKLLNYFKKHPVETVFHIGAVIMLIQQEWLPFLFCLVFPFFIPSLMRKKKDEKRKEQD